MNGTILLTCSKCGRHQREARQPHDPPRAVELNFADALEARRFRQSERTAMSLSSENTGAFRARIAPPPAPGMAPVVVTILRGGR